MKSHKHHSRDTITKNRSYCYAFSSLQNPHTNTTHEPQEIRFLKTHKTIRRLINLIHFFQAFNQPFFITKKGEKKKINHSTQPLHHFLLFGRNLSTSLCILHESPQLFFTSLINFNCIIALSFILFILLFFIFYFL